MLGDMETQVATTDLETEYEILGELGRGATAVVYRARDRELGREVAIKVIRPKYADDDETVARLAREARTVAQLQHPNIVTLYAVRRVRDGSLALVMQMVPGRTLRELLNERGPCTFERADRVLRDVAAALAHAHQRGIVHRDVKPENIFIDENTGQALLSDFGVARSLEADSQLTATGTAIGTPAYMSPEQIDGTELDGRSDLYSLGLVGWEMLTGRRPWEGEGLYSVIYKQKREDLPPIDELRPDAPNRLVYLIEGATKKDPAERWRGANELIERASMIAPEGGWARWQTERRKRRRAMVYAAARERGDSVVAAALETVRFRRDAASGTGSVTLPRERELTRKAVDAGASATTTPERRPRRAWIPVVVVLAIGIGAIAAGTRVMRGRTPPPDARRTATFADNGGVEVPVGGVPSGAATSSATPPGAVADSIDSLAAPPNAATTPARGVPDTSRVPAGPARVTPGARASNGADSKVESSVRSPSPDARTTSSSGDVTGLRAGADAAKLPTLPPAPFIAPTNASGSTTAPVPDPRNAAPSVPVAPVSGVGTVSFPADRATVAAGGRHSCALDPSGAAMCWGANDQGQLGEGTRDDHTAPTVVAGDLTLSQVSAGSSHTCAVTRDGDVYCWGNNERGQLGDATTLERDTPVRVGAAGPFRLVRAGFSHSCALSRSGEILCWGSNAYGQLGTGAGLTSSRPGEVAGGLRFGALAVGWNHSCGINVFGDLYCWGSNNAGQLGDGTRDDRRTPTRVASSARFVAVAAGNQHTCAVTTSGQMLCWGRNNYGQLATGAGDRSQPTPVDGEIEFSTVTAGAVHTCGRTAAGAVYCWGRNTFGQLGDGTTVDRSSPVRVVGMPSVVTVQATGAHTCAATAGGENYCWGYNVEGQLGDGTRNHRPRPAHVATVSR
jgi:alpha-tubulin suppressor-like RCC1 family protein/tRNA A-37 threonylcarbamoyl transferase component Bud32